ncbi:hypothetical protein BGW38_009433, partial [Lunasporangiospora selenospora]
AMTTETPAAEIATAVATQEPKTTEPASVDPASSQSSSNLTKEELSVADAIVGIGNDVLASGAGRPSTSGTVTPSEEGGISGAAKFSFNNSDNDDDYQDAVEDLPATRKLHQRLSSYSPQVRETEEWEQIMQDWQRVMAEKRIQDAKFNLLEQENKRMKAQLVESETARSELEKETQDRIQQLEKTNKELVLQNKDPAKETKTLKNQLEESEAERELFKLMLEETEAEKKRVEHKMSQLEREKDIWAQKGEKIKTLKGRLRVKAAQFSLLSTSTSSLLVAGLDGALPGKERRRLVDQVSSLESERSRLAAIVKETISGSPGDGDGVESTTSADLSTSTSKELANENQKLSNELQMAKVEQSLLQRRIEALEVTLHDIRVALTNSESHTEDLEAKKYDLQDKLAAAEGSLDRTRIESIKYQNLHKEMLEKNDKLDRELQVVKTRFDAKDRVLITTQKQLAAAKADGGLLKTIRRELESVLFDYNTVVQHFMDIQVQAMGAKALANALKRQNNELQAQLNHYRSMLLGIKSFNNNDPIKSPTVTTLRTEFRILLEKIQEEQNTQVEKERADKFKAQDWNRKLRMEKDFMKLELQNQIEKWKRVSIFWEDKWRKTQNDLHEVVTTNTTSEMLFEVAGNLPSSGSVSPGTLSTNHSQRSSLAISTAGAGAHSTDLQHIFESKRLSASGGPPSRQASTTYASPTLAQSMSSPSSATISGSLTDLVSGVKPFLERTLSGTGSNPSTSGSSSAARGPSTPSTRLAAAASLRTPIAAGLPSNISGVGAMGNSTASSSAVSKTSMRSKSMAASAIGSARSQALQAGVPGVLVAAASNEAQARADSSISSVTKSVDQALSESDKLKADIQRMLHQRK